MKREFLQNLQTEGKPLSKEVIDAIMAENGRDIQKTKAVFADYDQMKEELVQAQQQISRLQELDFEGMRRSVQEWEEKYDQQVRQHSQQLSQLQFDHTLQTAIARAGGRSEKAIAALLDLECLKKSEDQPKAIEEALKQLRQDSGYLFGQTQIPPLYARGTGSQTGEKEEAPATLAGALKEKYERK